MVCWHSLFMENSGLMSGNENENPVKVVPFLVPEEDR